MKEIKDNLASIKDIIEDQESAEEEQEKIESVTKEN